ncbi:MAG: hypothetical protein IKE90_04310 [Bacilli bacterium]|nr:hypothetical protein [Bacilli bacterium]
MMYMLLPMTVFSKVSNYLATGDSIAYGYGLPNIAIQSYPQIVRNKLGVDLSNFKNLSVSGMTCQEYYSTIQTSEYKTAIQNADLMTVSIGSNEMLELITGALSEVTGIPANDPAFLQKVKQVFNEASLVKKYEMATAIYNFFTSQETKVKLNQSLNTYTEYWDKSVKYIKSINNNINIIATEFYNPYYEIQIATFDLSGFIDEWIVKMNSVLNSRSNGETDYKVAKIYNAFNTTNPRLTNVDINLSLTNMNIELDPHPNVAGHEMIASKVMDAYYTIKETKKNISELFISEIKDQVYSGNEIRPSITVKDGNKILVENTDYTVIYINNVNVGEAKVNIVGIGNYSGNVVKTFNIKEQQIQKKSIVNLSFSNIENQIYIGTEIKPDIEIKDGNKVLAKNRDYEVVYKNNINVGNASMIVRGVGSYEGTVSKEFSIIPKNIIGATIAEIQDQQFTGSEIKPVVVVYDGSAKLIENKDYKLSFNNNVQVGTATVLISGMNNYNGEISKNFNIIQNLEPNKKDISQVQCSEIESKIYTGKLITPEVILVDSEKILIKDVDYKINYENNIDVGTGRAIITGIGVYAGSVVKNFSIVKKDVNHTYIEDIPDQVFEGKDIRPVVTITNDKIKLTEGIDYTVEYVDNNKVGTARIVINGINNFTGVMVKSFNIVQPEIPPKDDIPQKRDTVDPQNRDEKNIAEVDATVSNKPIPQTGQSMIIGSLIAGSIIVLIGLRIWLKKYKNI